MENLPLFSSELWIRWALHLIQVSNRLERTFFHSEISTEELWYHFSV